MTREKICGNKRDFGVILPLSFLVLFLSLSGGCANAKISRSINNIQTANKKNFTQKTIIRIFKDGKTSIPLLIDNISEKRGAFAFELKNPLNQKKEQFYLSFGFLYAYLVELILAKDTLEIDLESKKLLMSSDNYIFWEGSVIPGLSDRIVTADEALIEIQRYYRQWWNENKHKSLQQLRKEWKLGKRPLNGSKYGWQ